MWNLMESSNDAIKLLFETVTSLVDGIDNFYLNHPRTLFALLLIVIYMIYYLRIVVRKPLLFCGNQKLKSFLVDNCSVISDYYWPTFWCYETHLLTALSNLIRRLCFSNLNYHKVFLSTPDGGQISLDWYNPQCDADVCKVDDCSSPVHSDDGKPIALFLPGLTGSSQAEYIKPMAVIAHRVGYRVVVINHRGLGNTPLLTPRLYCAANDDDLRLALQHIRKHYSKSRIVATGFSLGGVILARYLISSSADTLVDAACLVSMVWDFFKGCQNMEVGLNYPLNQHLTRCLMRIVNEHEAMFSKVVDMSRVRSAKDLRSWDEEFTVRMFNFENLSHYYSLSSQKGKINNIKRPCLCLSAADDMFAPFDALPMQEIDESEQVAMLVTARGGHIGFMESILPTGNFYSERVMAQYFESLYKLDDFSQIVH